MSLKSVFKAVLVFGFSSVSVVFGQIHGPVQVLSEFKHDVSPPLRNIPPLPSEGGQHINQVYLTPQATPLTQSLDPVLQSQAGTTAAPVAALNFDGVGVGFTGPNGTFIPNAAPPDTNGVVGNTQYVQWVNESFAVFDKATGTPVLGPVTGQTLWSGFGGKCQNNNDGDIIAQYDKVANRWVLTQFAVSGSGGFFQCLAISQTSDATGSYFRYAFQYSFFNDYPKLGVWPDAYYMTFNMFNGQNLLGPQACAMDRARMLAGLSATQVCFQLSNSVGTLLPSDLDGSTPPPGGSPNFILTFATNALNLFKFHVDFVNPGNSTLTGPFNIPVAPFSPACGGGSCIPQLGTSQRLDSLGDRLMYRLAYRNFGDHEAVVANHSIATSGGVGVRWYELRNLSGAPSIFQQGTYSPTSEFRWMGSIAMDKLGDIALGYSLSSTTRNPSIGYAVRAPGDPAGQLGAEALMIAGTGSQGPNLNRWGDYSAMTIDPVDDCTFWYTTEYLKTNGRFNWSTRIANFKMDNCNPSIGAGLRFFAVNPCRVLDTRNANGPLGGPSLVGGATRDFPIPSSACGIPSNAKAYSFNATVVPQGSLGYLTLWPTGSPQPFVSALNSLDGGVKANAAIVPAGTTGSISAFATNNTDLILDINGYFLDSTSGPALEFYPLPPCRVADTRNADGPLGGPILTGGTSRSFPVLSSACGIPATAQAYVLNATVVPQTALGYLTLWPTGVDQPFVSTLNAFDAQITANMAIVPAGTGGAISAFVTDNTQLIFDISGYFAPAGAGGLNFYTLTPCRVVDTRLADGPLGGPIMSGNTSRSFPVLSGSCGIPATSQAYSLHATVVPSGSLGYLTVWPTGVAQPVVSTLNAFDAQIRSNSLIPPAGTDGAVSAYVTDTTQLIFDINGYFAP
jgi:hypothetical protein